MAIDHLVAWVSDWLSCSFVCLSTTAALRCEVHYIFSVPEGPTPETDFLLIGASGEGRTLGGQLREGWPTFVAASDFVTPFHMLGQPIPAYPVARKPFFDTRRDAPGISSGLVFIQACRVISCGAHAEEASLGTFERFSGLAESFRIA